MKIYHLPKFARQFKKLSEEVKKLAVVKEKIFRLDPFDARLKTHKLSGYLNGFLAFSIDYSNRIIFDFDDNNDARFYSVGSHDVYD